MSFISCPSDSSRTALRKSIVIRLRSSFPKINLNATSFIGLNVRSSKFLKTASAQSSRTALPAVLHFLLFYQTSGVSSSGIRRRQKKNLLCTHSAEEVLSSLCVRQSRPSLSRRMTSCAPPSTILVEETSVSFALSRNSGRLSAPQLHMVERILERVVSTFSLSGPAYGT